MNDLLKSCHVALFFSHQKINYACYINSQQVIYNKSTRNRPLNTNYQIRNHSQHRFLMGGGQARVIMGRGWANFHSQIPIIPWLSIVHEHEEA